MLKSKQNLKQKQEQRLQQKLSPQQLQLIGLLQLNTLEFKTRIENELYENPFLEESEEITDEKPIEFDDKKENEDGLESLDDRQVEWDDYEENTDYDGNEDYFGYNHQAEEKQYIPDPYHESQLEKLEQQALLLNLSESEKIIAEQILGSLDNDGYLEREMSAIADKIAYDFGYNTTVEDVDRVRRKIQLLEPIGIASLNLKDCLLVQLRQNYSNNENFNTATTLIKETWKELENRHYDDIIRKLKITKKELEAAYNLILKLDHKPGNTPTQMDEVANYIEPDFEVYWVPENQITGEKGAFTIQLNKENSPELRISPEYKQMWEDIDKRKSKSDKQTYNYMKENFASANWFMEAIKQRNKTMEEVMKTIVRRQVDFFKTGTDLQPMILEDVAERIGMDISTVSRVVNGKYVQTNFGVFELKYFFNEAIKTKDGVEVANREVKNLLLDIVENEDKNSPLSDQALTDLLNKKGFEIARRTVNKYRKQLGIQEARLRREIV